MKQFVNDLGNVSREALVEQILMDGLSTNYNTIVVNTADETLVLENIDADYNGIWIALGDLTGYVEVGQREEMVKYLLKRNEDDVLDFDNVLFPETEEDLKELGID